MSKNTAGLLRTIPGLGNIKRPAFERGIAMDEWEENKHPRAENGQFGSGGGGSKTGSGKNDTPETGHAGLDKFLGRFPNDARSWSDATDEVRDIAKEAREHLEEMSGKPVQPLNFRDLSTPSEWNTKGKKFIADTYAKMDKATKNHFHKYLEDHFDIKS